MDERNRAVFDNGKTNKLKGRYAALNAPNSVGLTYPAPPYFSGDSNQRTIYPSPIFRKVLPIIKIGSTDGIVAWEK